MDLKNMSDKSRENASAMFCYTVLVVILAACYLLEVIKGSRTVFYYLTFLILLLVPYVICKVMVVKDRESDSVRYVMAGGFFIFYLYVIFTTISVIAYVYAIMIAVVLICYNDNKVLVSYMVGVTIGNIAHVLYLGVTHQITSDVLPDLEIRIASLILFTLFLSKSARTLELTNRNRVEEVEREKERVSRLMEQILRVSNEITANIGTVSEKMDILSETANKTRVSMEEVNQGTGDTVDSIQMQMKMTEEIHQAIDKVSDSTNSISDNIEATKKEIQESKYNIDELIHHVELSNQSNKNVSEEIEKLNDYAEKMQSIIGLINGITSQTSLLALNASIEAARAGEAGRGFAVVASEISNLATQTSEATINITELIDNVSSELTNMVHVIGTMLHNAEEQNVFANKTAHSFEEIASITNLVYRESDKLREMVTNLSEANEQVIRGIETISSATEEVTAHSGETLESTERNSSIAGEVEEIVEVLSNLASELSAVES